MIHKQKCKTCENVKPKEEFGTYKRNYGIALRKHCKKCVEFNSKIPKFECQICGVVKPRKEFPSSVNSRFGVELSCKPCKKAQQLATGVTKQKNLNIQKRYAKDPKYKLKRKLHAANYRRENWSKVMLTQARVRARNSKIDFSIDLSDIIIPERCPILDIELIKNDSKRLGNSASLDRVDNNKGYIKGNVRVISFKANHMKANASIQELLKFSQNIIKYIKI